MAFVRARAAQTLKASFRPRSANPGRTYLPRYAQAGQRRWQSGGGHGDAHSAGSDIPWLAGAVVVTVPGAWYLWPDASHADAAHHHGGHDAHAKEEGGKEEETESQDQDEEKQSSADDSKDDGESAKEEKDKKEDGGSAEKQDKKEDGDSAKGKKKGDESGKEDKEEGGDGAETEDKKEGGDSDKKEKKKKDGDKSDKPAKGDDSSKSSKDDSEESKDDASDGADSKDSKKDGKDKPQAKGKMKEDADGQSDTRKTEANTESRGGSKKRIDSGYQKDIGGEDKFGDAATAKTPEKENDGDMTTKQKGLFNTSTRHSTQLDEDPEKSKKGEGTPETAKAMGTVDSSRPAR